MRPIEPLSVLVHRADMRANAVCTGEIDCATADQLYIAVIGLLTDHTTEIVEIDLSGVTFFGAAGLRVLARLQDAARTHAKTVRVDRISPTVRRVLDLTGLEHLRRTPLRR
ncbi:STAS domain-containing protein [Nocardia yamanashiensis]|uniref:STAS domain-containing protein n=1 Tax=Nocardia yamanashiensis TaxID=209247 RepID=UPI001E387F11|nr:STAS domain-containing protein [Nocardia yamanashiensis]UGT43220.1 STAS domain-containing protein [Nocardia yamanashiensis]